jgi:hypothetical protein
MKKVIIEVVKTVTAIAVGATIGAIARPSIDEFFKIKKKSAEPEVIPSEDIEEDEVTDEE